MSQNIDLKQQNNRCEGCGGISGENFEECPNCLSFLTAFQTLPDKKTTNPVAIGGKAHDDVIPLQGFRSEKQCDQCRKPEGSNPACDLCATLKKSQEEGQPPFTKEQVKQLHLEMKSWFIPSPRGRTFELVVPLSSLTIGRIDWTTNNCAFSTLLLMLSNSNAGLNSINQQTFAGYLLAVIINALQETGKCDPIFIEVFRLELSIVSQNRDWSNWSYLVEFHELYNVCVRRNVIIDDEVDFVLPNDDGSYNIGQTLNRKCGSKLVGAHKWFPCVNDLSNGILSQDFYSRFRISSVVLHHDDHFSIILVNQGIWLIDGKGTRNGPFKAESSIQELTIEEFQQLCLSNGVFYFFEEVPVVYNTLNLFGIQDLPPRKVFYGKGWYFLYDNGTMICETTGTRVYLQRTVFVNDDSGNHFRVFPHIPPPPLASCAQSDWVPPPPPLAPCAQSGFFPPPPPLAPCASGHWGPELDFPPPPQQAPCAQSAHAIQVKQQLSVKIEDVNHYVDQDGMRKWSVSTSHPTRGQITLSGGWFDNTNRGTEFFYTFDTDNSKCTKMFKYEPCGPCKKFIEELNRRLNSSE